MKRDVHTFRLIGEALFGEEWQTPLAHALDVTGRMVRYWADPRPGEGKPIPDGVWLDLAKLCRQHGPIFEKRAKTLARIAQDLAG